MYTKWIVLLFSFRLIFAEWTPERIMGGHLAVISSFPWMASLQVNGEHDCGAAIYSNEILITAAHCVQNRKASSLTVRVGSANRHSGGQLVNVSHFIAHAFIGQTWLFKDYSNDVAIIKLERPLVFNSNVKPISLASDSPVSGSKAFFAGWGKVGPKLPKSDHLIGVKFSIVDYESCLKENGPVITKVMICAGAPGKGILSADSGGALVSGGQLVGIASASRDDPGYPVAFADVAKLRPWILETIKKI